MFECTVCGSEHNHRECMQMLLVGWVGGVQLLGSPQLRHFSGVGEGKMCALWAEFHVATCIPGSVVEVF